MTTLSAEIRIGTSGWSYDDWVGPFYQEGTPSGRYLSEYARSFGTVEVDSTFYNVPAGRTFETWAATTPGGFLFALKVPGTVTHGASGERARIDKVLVDEERRLELFVERAMLLGDKLAAIVFQFPYFRVSEFSLREFLPRLEATLAGLPRGLRVAVEIRNKGWIVEDYLSLLEAHGAAAVLVDHAYMPGPEEQLRLGLVTADFAYVRLLGDRYAIEEKTKLWDRIVEDRSERLERWAQVIAEIASRPGIRRIFAYSNNHYAGHAPATCRELASKLGVPMAGPAGAPLPPTVLESGEADGAEDRYPCRPG